MKCDEKKKIQKRRTTRTKDRNFPNNNASKKREEKIQYLHVFKTPRKNKCTYELHQCIRRKKRSKYKYLIQFSL